jgi:hypothetical protein
MRRDAPGPPTRTIDHPRGLRSGCEMSPRHASYETDTAAVLLAAGGLQTPGIGAIDA